jgi:hypothetical protein
LQLVDAARKPCRRLLACGWFQSAARPEDKETVFSFVTVVTKKQGKQLEAVFQGRLST